MALSAFRPLALIALILLAACGSTADAVRPRVTKFSSALSDTTEGVTKSFATAESIYRDRQVDDLVTSYAAGKLGGKPDFKPLFAPGVMEARTQVLRGLQLYSKQLADIVSGSSATQLADADTKLVENLKKLSDSDFVTTSSGFKLDNASLAGIGAAVNALGDFLIEQKINTDLPLIIRRMNEPVKKISALFDADLGDPRSSGLREIIQRSNRDRLQARDELIRLYIPPRSTGPIARPALAPDAIRSEVNGVASIDVDADAMMVATQEALKAMVTAHNELEKATDPRRVSVDVAVDQFLRQASAINDFYQKVLSDLKK